MKAFLAKFCLSPQPAPSSLDLMGLLLFAFATQFVPFLHFPT
jgi:hypothetical protein